MPSSPLAAPQSTSMCVSIDAAAVREQVYKTFKSFKLSDDPSELDDAQLNDLRRILSYWAVMGVFTFAEFFLDFFMSWIPFFFETKILFLVSGSGIYFCSM